MYNQVRYILTFIGTIQLGEDDVEKWLATLKMFYLRAKVSGAINTRRGAVGSRIEEDQ